MGVLVTTAIELTAALNAENFSLSFEAVRSYGDFDMPLTDADKGLRVDVVPVAPAAELADRSHLDWELAIDIGIRQRLRAEASEEMIKPELVDPLVDLLQEIVGFLATLRLGSDSVWRAGDVRGSHDREVLRQTGMFLGIIRPTFENYANL